MRTCVDKAIDAMQEDGTLAQIQQRWLSDDDERARPEVVVDRPAGVASPRRRGRRERQDPRSPDDPRSSRGSRVADPRLAEATPL